MAGIDKTKQQIRLTINQLVGMLNKDGKLVVVGNYEGIYYADKYSNRDHALVRISQKTSMEGLREIEKLELPHVLQSLVLIPINLTVICKESSNKKGVVK